MLLSPLPGVLAPDLSLSNGIWAGLPLFPCTQLGAIPWHTEVWGIAVCSSTAAAFRRWAKRSPHRVDLSVWLAPWDSVGWKVRQKWMLYKYFWDLEIQATEKSWAQSWQQNQNLHFTPQRWRLARHSLLSTTQHHCVPIQVFKGMMTCEAC